MTINKVSSQLKKISKRSSDLEVEFEFASILTIVMEEFNLEMVNTMDNSHYIGNDIDFVKMIIDNMLTSIKCRELDFYKEFFSSGLYNQEINELLRDKGFDAAFNGSDFDGNLGGLTINELCEEFADLVHSTMPLSSEVKVNSTKLVNFLLDRYEGEVLEYLNQVERDYQ